MKAIADIILLICQGHCHLVIYGRIGKRTDLTKKAMTAEVMSRANELGASGLAAAAYVIEQYWHHHVPTEDINLLDHTFRVQHRPPPIEVVRDMPDWLNTPGAIAAFRSGELLVH